MKNCHTKMNRVIILDKLISCKKILGFSLFPLWSISIDLFRKTVIFFITIIIIKSHVYNKVKK